MSSHSFIEVPKERLDPATLRRLIEEYVSREGTDYGAEYSMDQKISHVMQQLDTGRAVIVFDPESESVNIITKDQLDSSR